MHGRTSLVPSPTPSFSSLLYRTKQRRKAGRGTGNEAMVGPQQAVYMVTAVLLNLAYSVSYYLWWQLYSGVPPFPVFWLSEMTSTTF